MRKLVLFLILFGAGLAVLLLLDRRKRSAPEPPADVVQPEPAKQEPRDVAPVAGDEVEIAIRGAVELTRFDRATGAKRYTFRADVEPRPDGVYEARDVEIESFDPVTESLRETILAERGRARIEWTDGARTAVLGDGGRVELFDVEITQHVGGPVVPLTLTAATLVAELDRRVYRAQGDEPVVARGPGLEASGRGLVLDGVEGTVVLADGGQARFATESGAVHTFSTSPGSPLFVERVGVAGSDAFQARAPEGGELTSDGTPPTRVRARSIELFGRPVEGAVVIERASAEGDVVATRSGDRFEGDSARARFGATGGLEALDVEREPRWSVTLVDAEGRRVPLEGEGEGSLEVDLRGPSRFVLLGPSRLHSPGNDLEIEAGRSMRGTFEQSGRDGHFEAEGDVRLVRGPHRLETERLAAVFTVGATDGEGALDVSCDLESTLRGPDETGRELIAIARGGLDFEARGRTWRVPLARDVVISSVEGEPFVASASVVRDLDVQTGSFLAEGGVRHESARGVGRASSARASGRSRVELRGDEDEPARFDAAMARGTRFAIGSFEAAAIDLTEDRVEARGDVHFDARSQGRTYRFSSDDATLDSEPVAEGAARPFVIVANGMREASIEEDGSRLTLVGRRLGLRGRRLPEPDSEEGAGLVFEEIEASGDVRIDYTGEYEVRAVGQRLHVSEDGVARLDTFDGRRISAWGGQLGRGVPYELTARSLTVAREHVVAEDPDLFLAVDVLSLGQAEQATPRVTNASADTLVLDAESLLLQGSVRMAGTDGSGLLATMEAENMRLSGDFRWNRPEPVGGDIERIQAWGGWRMRYGDGGDARGERLDATRERAVFDGDPARIEFLGYAVESDHFELDLERFLLSSSRGIVRADDERGSWFLEYASLRPVVQGDETIVVASSPVYSHGTSGARADWIVVWIDGPRWARDCGREVFGQEPLETAIEEPPPLPDEDLYPNLFRKLRDERVQSYLHAAYAEGNIEFTEGALQSARGNQFYLDMDENVGALTGAEVVFAVGVGSESQRLRTRADELLIGADGTLRAQKATITACDHDVPHYVIETGKLQLEPREGGRWVFNARHNRIRFRNGFAIPLPKIGNLVLDEDGSVEGFETGEGEILSVQDIALSSTPRFGTAIGTRFSTEIGRIGLWIARLFGFDVDVVKGRWESEVEYLGSRGLLGTLGLRFREPREGVDDDFWLDLYVSGIPDGADDKGLVRVDESERDTLRLWTRGRGRYPFSDRQWIDLAFSTQTDAGVQSEFFERDFVRYDQRDNYVRWRLADGASLYEATARTRVDEFRTDVEQLPSVGAYFGEREVARSGSFALMYGTNVDVDHLKRRQGAFEVVNGEIVDEDGHVLGVDEFTFEDRDVFNDNLEEIFADGLGDREVLRVDNVHRLSAPVALGAGGLRATPYLEGHLTAWDKGVDPEDQPARAALLGGIDLATTLWRSDSDGFMSELSPEVGVRTDLAIEEGGGQPVIFDQVDEPLDGTVVEAGLRTRWWKPQSIHRFDLELRGMHVSDRAEGLDDFGRVAVLGDWRTEFAGMPVGFVQDARYRFDETGTPYSRSVVAIAPLDDLVLEVGYSRGADRELHRLFEAAGLGARWRATPKWEFGLQQVLDVRGGGNLQNQLELRRFSHDFLVEMAVGTRAGEGGLAISLSVRPTLGWKPSRGGLLGML